MKSRKNRDVRNGRHGEEGEHEGNKGVRESKRGRINKGSVLERVGGMEEKRGRRERKARGYTRRKKPTESKMKEREVRVGGRQGKTGEEKEAAKMKA